MVRVFPSLLFLLDVVCFLMKFEYRALGSLLGGIVTTPVHMWMLVKC
jgi:hypothetical protein